MLRSDYIVYNLSSDKTSLKVEFPYSADGMSWAETVTCNLVRGDHDNEWESPYYRVAIEVSAGVEEKAHYADHELDQIADWNSRLAHEVPMRLETLFRLWSPRQVWVTGSRPDTGADAELRRVQVGPTPFELKASEIPLFEEFANKLGGALDEVARLESKLLRAEVATIFRKEKAFEYHSLLTGADQDLFDRHFANAFGLRWHSLCYRLERGLRVEQTLVASTIVLESLFGDEGKGSKSYVRARAAELLGLDSAEASALRIALDDLYKLRNSVVHSGSFKGHRTGGYRIPPVDAARRSLVLRLAAATGGGFTRTVINSMLDRNQGSVVREAAAGYLGSSILLDRVMKQA